MKFLIFHPNSGFAGSLECQALQTLLFPKEYQGFVKGCGWLKTWKTIIFIKIHKISRLSMKLHKFHKFPPISQVFGPAALARKKDSNSYAFSMVAALMFPPRAPQNMFFLKILVSNHNFGDFHEILWNLAPELGFEDSEGSLAGPGWKPQYSYRNIKVSEPPRTTRITPKRKKTQNFRPDRTFPFQNWFFPPLGRKNLPRTLCLCRVLGRGHQCQFLVPQMRFWCPKS